jgi:protein-S-isoprenylcysteine O-methyltransferase Ste14
VAGEPWWHGIRHPVLLAAFWLAVGIGIGALWLADRDAWPQLVLATGWVLVAVTYVVAWRKQRRGNGPPRADK